MVRFEKSLYFQQLYALMNATLDVLTSDPTTAEWPAARAHLTAARRAIERENWQDQVVRRFYWRCRAAAAAHCGNSPAAALARLRGWFC